MLELGSSLEEFKLLNTVSGNDFSSNELDEAKPSLTKPQAFFGRVERSSLKDMPKVSYTDFMK